MSTDRTSCEGVLEKLPLSVGGDLEPEALAALREHLERCSSCAGRASAASRARGAMIAVLRSREADSARPELWPGIRAALRVEGLIQDPARPARTAPAARTRWMTRALVPLAAAAALVALLQLGSRPGAPAPGAAHVRPAPDIGRGAPVVTVTAPLMPAGGGLRRVTSEDLEPVKIFRPRGGRPGMEGGEASLTGFENGYR